MAKVSVVMPVFNGEKFLPAAIDSIINQTFTDWEFIIVNEFGSNAAAAEILAEYELKDKRIRVIQNQTHLGIAESLNAGIRASSGEYIARMDGDDLSHCTRFQKQISFLEDYPEVGICGTWQWHQGRRGGWVHKPPADQQELAASLLFSCEMCHSTVMMRHKTLVRNGLFYDKAYAAEDFELWGRALAVTTLANLPEVLGEYRYGNTLTAQKQAALEREHGALCAAAMERTLNLRLAETDFPLLNAWKNPFRFERNQKRKKMNYERYAKILRLVWEANNHCGVFDSGALLRVLRRRWVWARWDIEITEQDVTDIADVFRPAVAPHSQWVRQRMKRRFQKFHHNRV